ncbi:MAG: lysozyme inhibitor LprI family protein [Paracoccaceae bacterium]
MTGIHLHQISHTMMGAMMAIWLGGAPVQADHLNCSLPDSQAERNQCTLLNYENAYRELRALWSEAMMVAGKLDVDLGSEEEAASLVLYDAQNRWINFSERACEAEGLLWRGKPVQSQVYYNCMLRLTEERMMSLRAFVGQGAEAAGAEVHEHTDGTTHLHYD